MALHLNPAAHDADPPTSWTVVKSGKRWALLTSTGDVLDTYPTKAKAEADKTSGFYFNLYQHEGRWFAGETPRGHRSYADCVAERDATAARWR